MLPATSKVLDRAEEAGALVERFDDEAELIITRTLSAEGRSRASVGGRAAPVGVLVELGEDLMAIHGQTDQLRLKGAAAQRASLDKFAGAPLAKVLATYQETFDKWGGASAELEELVAASRERIREAESLQVALEEIDAVDPQPAEDVELKNQSLKLSNVEALRSNANLAHEALNSEDYEATSVISLVETAQARPGAGRRRRRGHQVAGRAAQRDRHPRRRGLHRPGRLPLGPGLRGPRTGSPRSRNAAADLNRLIRKYAPDIDQVIAWADTSRTRLTEIQGDDGRIEELRAETEALRLEVADAGRQALQAARQGRQGPGHAGDGGTCGTGHARCKVRRRA